ncbi:MAG: hypothetical protein ACRC1T_05260 [Clostridium chrysemydis]|uniref:hypothetical protein n=1 Tax=Clostridium chrysemydis TaxID=2665504 RepID=UPI003F303DA5
MRRWLKAIRKSIRFNIWDFPFDELAIVFLVGGSLFGIIGLIINNETLLIISLLIWLIGFVRALMIICEEILNSVKALFKIFRDFIARVKSNLDKE